MAEQLLKAWNAPSLVASVTLDAAKQTATADNATITGATFGANIKWDELDNALPFPYSMKDPVTALALSSSDFIAALDQEPLTVTGLTGANYDLTIDSTDIGNFTAAQLTAGVNLATYDTPMYEQSLLVYQQIVKHDFLHTERWQRVQVPFAGDKSPGVSAAAQALMTALDNEEQTEVENLRAASQPVLHHFTLTPKP